jgi:hypothetical protein
LRKPSKQIASASVASGINGFPPRCSIAVCPVLIVTVTICGWL